MLSLFVPDYSSMYEERKAAERAALSKPIPPGDMNEILREQLDSLIEHVEAGHCGCAACDRYQRVRRILMEVFGEPAPARAMGAG